MELNIEQERLDFRIVYPRAVFDASFGGYTESMYTYAFLGWKDRAEISQQQSIDKDRLLAEALTISYGPIGVTFDGMLWAVKALVKKISQPQGEPVAWMWQHDETGRIGFVDAWQVTNGFFSANPNLLNIGPLVRS